MSRTTTHLSKRIVNSPTGRLLGLAGGVMLLGFVVQPVSLTEAAEPGESTTEAPAVPALDFRSASSRDFPAAARSVLSLFERAGREIATFAFTYDGEYVIVGNGGQPMFSPGFPSEPQTYVEQYTGTGRQVEVVAFSRTGQWLIIAEDWLRRKNIPSAANSRIRSLQSAGKTIDSFAFSPVDTNGWILVSDGNAYMGGTLPDGLPEAVNAAKLAKRPIHEMAVSHTGEWVLIADDWYATGGLSVQRGFLRTMDEFRTDQDRRIDHVVLKKLNGKLEWAILSNRDEWAANNRMARIENRFRGTSSIYERMKTHQITGLSLAIVENNRIAWRRSYGIRNSTGQEAVYPNTIFQAASISKPIAAFGALQLVDQGKVRLDDGALLADLNGRLFASRTSGRRPGNATGPASSFLDQFEEPYEITLNRLLSHCAGVLHPAQVNGNWNSTGAQAFSYGSQLPALEEMLVGDSPACCEPTQTSGLEPGTRFQYSGANYLLVQAIIDEYSQGGFDRHMRDLFRSLEMNSTTYETPAPAFGTDRYARGHINLSEQPVYAYPNKAAASISTTADDLARFAIALNRQGRNHRGQVVLNRSLVRALAGEHGALNQSCANRTISSARGDIGLGLMNTGDGTWHHGGTRGGYRSFLFARPVDRWALAVLATGHKADVAAFMAELEAALVRNYSFLQTGMLPR